MQIETDYNFFGKIEYYIKSNDGIIEKVEYLDKIFIYVSIPKDKYKKICDYIDEFTSKTTKYNILQQKYR